MCTDHVTIFQLHNVGSGEKMAAVMGPNSPFEGLQEGIRAGKIGSAAFSAHSLSVAADMIRTGLFDAVQVPFNFVDCQAADEVIPLARTADMGIIAMKPLGGGLLDDARLCFRYLQQFPDVVPDPGVETPEQMRQILHVMESAGPLTVEETGLIEGYRTQLGTEWCHRCDYCQPCPRHIQISTVLNAKSFARRMPREKAQSLASAAFEAAESCQHCRACVQRCPYHLEMPGLLERQRSLWDAFLKTGTWA